MISISDAIKSAAPQRVSSLGGKIEQIAADWKGPGPFNARAVLAVHPELGDHRSALIDLAYEEYCRCPDSELTADPEAFAANFPTIFRSLVRVIEVHRAFDDSLVRAMSRNERAWPELQQVWLGFELLDELGRGAFSRVYLARERALGDRLVVVKATAYGRREAETLGKLQHPHIVPVHSVQRDSEFDLTAVCMPFLGRVTLFDVVDAVFSAPQSASSAAALYRTIHRLDHPGEAVEPPAVSHRARLTSYSEAILQIGVQLARALHNAHSQGILHRDVKPSNVLLTSSGQAFLLDFNLAVDDDDTELLAGGTLPYMAPEQLGQLIPGTPADKRILNQQTDIFCLGVTLFELLYGRLPFGTPAMHQSRDRAIGQLLEKQRRGPIFPPHSRPYVDRSVAALIARCLEFDPARRPASMDEIVGLIKAQLTVPRRMKRWVASHRRIAAGVVLATSACVAGLAIGLSLREPFPIREWRKGDASYRAGQFAAAQSHLTNALSADPAFVEARLLRARALFRQKDLVGALADFKSLVDDDRDGRATAGYAYVVAVLEENYRRAGVLFRRAAERGHASATVLNNLAFCLCNESRFDEAATFLRQAALQNPELSAPHQNLARIELRKSVGREPYLPDLNPIEKAISVSRPNAEVYLDAASIYAARAYFTSDFDERQNLFNDVFRSLNAAFELGLPLDQLPSVLSLNDSLAGDLRWKELEGRRLSELPFSRSVLFLDPLDEFAAPFIPVMPLTSPVERLPAALSGANDSVGGRNGVAALRAR